ncbi:hypothetical protein HOF65_07385 [bacterium]|nr:hypothetical protein [bacterium]MBT3853736.1 hypothetical protein [bacterium]MBT4633215.1 hypothetical protein [bacterium]MBT6779246.1 hypothetical protein [bacterium]
MFFVKIHFLVFFSSNKIFKSSNFSIYKSSIHKSVKLSKLERELNIM